MMTRGWRWFVVGSVAVAVLTVAPWATKRVQACGGIGLFSINCDGIIIANQIVQIGHMVSQINNMVRQLGSLDGVLTMTTELVGSNDPNMGNLGRVRDMLDRQWAMAKDGTGLATDPSGIGAYLQRIPGVTERGGVARHDCAGGHHAARGAARDGHGGGARGGVRVVGAAG